MQRRQRFQRAANPNVLRLLSRIVRPAAGQQPAPEAAAGDMVARSRDNAPKPLVTTERVSRRAAPGGKSVKSNQAWKYPGGNIVRAESVSINGRYYTDPKEPEPGEPADQGRSVDTMLGPQTGVPRRKQESNFMITINPNKTFVGADVSTAQNAFRHALEHLKENEVLARCLKFGPKHEHYLNDRPHDVILPGISWAANVEVGEKYNRMHCHIYVTIEHYSQIQINVPMMQYEFRQGFNAHSALVNNALHPVRLHDAPYLQVKLLPQSDFTTIMRQYIHKGMMADQ